MNNHFPSSLWQFCPFCGSHSFRAGDKDFLQCDLCLKRFYINSAGAVTCIIENSSGEILFTRRAFEPSKGMLDLPGGFIDLEETAEDAVRREIKEELNLDVTSMQYIGSSPNRYSYGGLVYFTIDLGFSCTVESFDTIRAADDVDGFIFLHPSRLDFQEIAFQSVCNILRTYTVKKQR